VCAAVFGGVLALVAAACSSSSPSGAQGSSTQSAGSTAAAAPVKIGYLCLCGGLGAADEQISIPAFTAWVKWTNSRGGINGHPVQLVTRNDPGNPGVALSEARQLVSEGVVALVERDSDDDAAWASYIQSTGVPVFNTTSGSSALAMSPDAFSTLVSVRYQPAEIAAAARKAGSTRLAVLYCAELAGCKQLVPVLTAAAQRVGVSVPFDSSVLSSAPNYTAQCLAARGAGADSLFVGGDAPTALRVMASCAQQGYNPHLVSTGGTFSKSFAQAPGTNGMIAAESTAPFFDTGDPAIAVMTAAFGRFAPGLTTSPNYSDVAVTQWATGLLIAAAAEASGVGTTRPLSAAALLDGVYALHSTNLGGLTPTLTFVKGQPHVNRCWFYATLRNGTFGTPFGLTPACAAQ
jgi:branched-chain amino acid transport system substrate-binding protein